MHLRSLVRVLNVVPLESFRVRLEFEGGTQREADLAVYLRGPVFEMIRNDPTMFRSARVEGGTIAWPNGADIDPDVLYYGLKPAWMEGERASDQMAYGAQKQAFAGLLVHEPTAQYEESSDEESTTS
jgi:hypothetical protein